MVTLQQHILASTMLLTGCSRIEGQPYRQMVKAINWIDDNQSRVEDIARKIPNGEWGTYSRSDFISDNESGTDEYENVIKSQRVIEYGIENCLTGGFYYDNLQVTGVNRCSLDENGYFTFDSALATVAHEKSHSLQDAHNKNLRFRTPQEVSFSLAVQYADIPYTGQTIHVHLYESDKGWEESRLRILENSLEHRRNVCERFESTQNYDEEYIEYYIDRINTTIEIELENYSILTTMDPISPEEWLDLRDSWRDIHTLKKDISITALQESDYYCATKIKDPLEEWLYSDYN